MTKLTITRERLEALANAEYCKSNHGAWLLGLKEVNELARMALAAMDSESGCLPIDYLQGHKDGLEWAARLAAKDGFVNVGEMERSGANYRYFTSISSGREIHATHWQPLPAAPHQEDL